MQQSGQMTVELVLLLVAILSVVTVVSTYMTQQGALQSMVEAPWTRLRGMIEYGDWQDYQDPRTQSLHPNYLHRHVSNQGDE